MCELCKLRSEINNLAKKIYEQYTMIKFEDMCSRHLRTNIKTKKGWLL